MISAVEKANEVQKKVLSKKIVSRFGQDLGGRTFAIWGLAFKPETDDMRDASSRVLIEDLLERGATIRAYDPVAMKEAQRIFGEQARIQYAGSAMTALAGADALVIVTEWKEFRSPDFAAIKASLGSAVVFDGRNLYDPSAVAAAGLEYFAIGRKSRGASDFLDA